VRIRFVLGFTLVALGVSALVVRIAHRAAPRAQAATYAPTRLACGVERWSVKTLTDPQARLINFHPHPTTVSALRLLAPTGFYGRGPGVERKTDRIRVRLVETKLEEDEDYHLVAADLRHPRQTMILEVPASNCTRGAASLRRRQMASARSSFIRACGYPSSSSFTRLRGTATITGVGFFDFLHGQTGVAPNGIELHPVLGFTRARCGPR
jgi:hypothetical protein